jgi:hypothetical protein
MNRKIVDFELEINSANKFHEWKEKYSDGSLVLMPPLHEQLKLNSI